MPILLGTIVWGLVQLYLQHESDQQLALDQQRATILQTYIDNMRNLLLTGHLTNSAPADEVARVQTLSTLRALDADRKSVV